jgi:hypothetical protein
MILELIKTVVLVVSFVAVLCIWATTGSVAYHAISPDVALMADAQYEGLFDWLYGVWQGFVIFACIAFWVVIALLGTFIILLVTIVLGVGSWLIQRITQGIAYLVGVIKGQWHKEPRADQAATIIVAYKSNGEPVSLPQWMSEAHKQLVAHDARILAMEKRNNGIL